MAPSACPSGALSAVKVWGGRLAQSSKSSGARLLTPMREEEDEDDSERVAIGARWRSGVRALKTGREGKRDWDSGVFGREMDDGPDIIRMRDDSGVFGLKAGMGGG